MKVTVVSHACVVDVNQWPFVWLERRADIELTLIAPRTWRSDLRGDMPFSRLPQFQSTVVALAPVFSGWGTFHFYRGAWQALSSLKPDVILLDEEPWSFCALQFAVLARRLGAKLVFYTKENLEKWYPPPFGFIERCVFGRADAAIALTSEVAAILRKKGYRGPISIVPHGIDGDPPTDQTRSKIRAQLGLEGVVIGYVGRFVPEKGVLDLLLATELLMQASPEPFRVLLIGSGPEEPQLRRHIADRRLGDLVTIVPAVPHDRMGDYYSALDVLVVPSRTVRRWKEQLGRVVIEAMAAGVPVVGSNSGAIPETIGDAGLVFSERDPHDLSRLLASLINDDTQRRTFAQRGRERVLAHYTNHQVASRVAETLQAVAAAG